MGGGEISKEEEISEAGRSTTEEEGATTVEDGKVEIWSGKEEGGGT